MILNADDENIKKVVDVSPFKDVVYVGKNDGSQFQAKNIKYANGGMAFTLKHENKEYNAFIPGYGEHNVYNALLCHSLLYFM